MRIKSVAILLSRIFFYDIIRICRCSRLWNFLGTQGRLAKWQKGRNHFGRSRWRSGPYRCTFSVNKTGWTREANVIAWNGRPAKLDIRDWSPDHTRMSRGITLNGEESDKLKEILEAAVVE